jgi:hypothetical protein
MNRTILCFTIIWILSSFLAAQYVEFIEWDTNRDGTIEQIEFRNGFMAEYFYEWDRNNDGILDDEDFFRSSYLIIDENNDNLLSLDEWKFGVKYLYYDYITDDFAQYDLDDNSFLTYDEYYSVISDTDYFTAFDADENSYISEYELTKYVFEMWDFDNSGDISKEEFYFFDSYFLDI